MDFPETQSLHGWDRALEIIRGGRFLVLATESGGRPHCSLMAYAPTPDCRGIVLATGSDTRKYRNIRANPKVSLLIDTRTEAVSPDLVEALTLEGEVLPGADAGASRELFIAAHPVFGPASGPGAAFLYIAIRSMLLLQGPEKALFLSVD